jgi:hypothetical protein
VRVELVFLCAHISPIKKIRYKNYQSHIHLLFSLPFPFKSSKGTFLEIFNDSGVGLLAGLELFHLLHLRDE